MQHQEGQKSPNPDALRARRSKLIATVALRSLLATPEKVKWSAFSQFLMIAGKMKSKMKHSTHDIQAQFSLQVLHSESRKFKTVLTHLEEAK